MKKLAPIALTLALVVGLAGCSSYQNKYDKEAYGQMHSPPHTESSKEEQDRSLKIKKETENLENIIRGDVIKEILEEKIMKTSGNLSELAEKKMLELQVKYKTGEVYPILNYRKTPNGKDTWGVEFKINKKESKYYLYDPNLNILKEVIILKPGCVII